MKIARLQPIAVPCLIAVAVIGVACGGGSSGNKPSDVSKIATATLPAKLPDPKILSGAVVQPGTTGRYTIKSGDTLSAVAAAFGVSLEDLLAANPGIDPQGLRSGDTIRLPETTAAAPTARPATSPTRAPATAAPATDVPATTAPATATAPATEAPPLPSDTPSAPPPPPVETPGPGATPTVASVGQTYVVQAGDFPATIAQKFGVSLEDLLAANPGIDPTNLQVGQVIVIPPKPNP